jgi:hypothetical protein
MRVIKQLYLDLYVIIFALYVYFGKGIAYAYLAEGLLVLGLLLILLDHRSFQFPANKRALILMVFVAVNCFYIVAGIGHYPAVEVIRDSFILIYIVFVFIVYLFKDHLVYFRERIFLVYKYYPLVMCSLFLLSFIPELAEFELFKGHPLLFFKYGDVCVHLFVAGILLMNGYVKIKRPFNVINLVMIAYLFMVAASFNRGGMLGFVASFGLVIFFSRNDGLRKQLYGYLKFVPIIILIALPFFLNTDMEENFQGRKAGVEQLKENVVSLFTSDDQGSLSDNKVWRIVWWTKIVEYTFGGQFFFTGKGLGPNLSNDDEIGGSEESDLRSPHSIHMTMLARFGVPFFIAWMYWVYLSLIRFRRKDNHPLLLIYLGIFFMFIFNASFDVFLEGPMGALPFWTFVGLEYASESFGYDKNIS